MKRQKHYPGALIPEHLTTMTVEHLPLDTPFYVMPGDPKDKDEPLTVFTTDDRKLRMSRTEIIDGDADVPHMPMGHVGIMRTLVPDEQHGMREVYVADLRLVDNHEIINLGNASLVESDQEDFMDWTAMVTETVHIEAFIAPDADDEFDPHEDFPKGALYGDDSLYPALKLLRKRTNKVMKRFARQQANPDFMGDAEVEDAESTSSEKQRKQIGAKSTSLSVKFIQPGE